MSFEHDHALTEKIDETPAVFRGFRRSDGQAIIAKILRAEYPNAVEVAQLKHEHEVISSLDLPGVVKTFGVEAAGNGLALILEDAGDESLDRGWRNHG